MKLLDITLLHKHNMSSTSLKQPILGLQNVPIVELAPSTALLLLPQLHASLINAGISSMPQNHFSI
jgi:hypothetical protein